MGTPNALTFNMSSAKTEIPTSIKSEDVDVKVEIKNVDVGAKGMGKATEDGIASKKPYSNSRPSYGKGQVDQV